MAIILLLQTILMMLREKVFVCTIYKENLSLRIISTSYFNQYLLCEVTCQNQKGYIPVIYCSPSQWCNEFEDFPFNLEKLINQIKQVEPSFTIILGDFHAKSSMISGQVMSLLLKTLILILWFLCMALIN